MRTGTRRAGGGVARFLSTPSPGRARIGTLRRAATPGRWQDDGVRRNRGRYRIRMDAAARKPATGPHGGRCPLPGPPPAGSRGGSFRCPGEIRPGRKSPGVHDPVGIDQGYDEHVTKGWCVAFIA